MISINNKFSKREKVFITIIVVLSIALLVCISELISKPVDSTINNTSSDTIADTTQQALEESESIKEEEKGDLIDIGINEYLNLKKSSDKNIIYIARPTCSYCQKQEPITRYLVHKYGIKVYYLNTDNLSASDQNTLINSDDMFKEGLSTPTTIIVQNDKVVGRAVGLNTIENYTNFFKNQELIN